jgi:hypothetical protein
VIVQYGWTPPQAAANRRLPRVRRPVCVQPSRLQSPRWKGRPASLQQNVAAIFGNAFDDTPLPPHPCGSVGLKGSVQITTLTNRVLALHTCTDDRVIARQFVQPIDDGPAIPPDKR